MGGAVSSGRDNNELIDNLMGGNYIRTRNVERVFRALDRADYMTPESRDQAYKDLAWRNGPLHLSSPCIYSEVMEGLELQPGLSFLNIGSGTGYLSTLAGLILGSGGISHGVEYHSSVVEYANKKLGQFITNSPTLDEFDFCEPKFYVGNGLSLMPQHHPYDRVYCGAGCPDEYENYFKQLIKVGGVLVMPLKDTLLQVRRVAVDQWETHNLLTVSFASLRVPHKDELLNYVQLDEQTPPRLQALARSGVRAAMRGGVLRRQPELREPAPRRQPPASCPRRICIPIEPGGTVDGLNILHDLDTDSGANEMNALLSLVIRMDQNRVAGAIRFDRVDTTSESETDSDDSSDDDSLASDNSGPQKRSSQKRSSADKSDEGTLSESKLRRTSDEGTSENGGINSEDKDGRRSDLTNSDKGDTSSTDKSDVKKNRSSADDGRSALDRNKHPSNSTGSGDGKNSKNRHRRKSNRSGDRKHRDRSARGPEPSSSDAARSSKDNNGRKSDRSTTDGRRSSKDKNRRRGPHDDKSNRPDRPRRPGPSGGLLAFEFQAKEKTPQPTTSSGESGAGRSTDTSTSTSGSGDGTANNRTRKSSCGCVADESDIIPAEVEFCFRGGKYGGLLPGTADLDMDWMDSAEATELLVSSDESDDEPADTTAESKPKRQKLDSGIGEAASGSSPDRSTDDSRRSDELDLAELSGMSSEARFGASTEIIRRRFCKRSRDAVRAVMAAAAAGTNSAQGAAAAAPVSAPRAGAEADGVAGAGAGAARTGDDRPAKADGEAAAGAGAEGAAGAGEEGGDCSSSSSSTQEASEARRNARRLRGPRRGYDARRTRLSILMKRAVKELPLPYLLKKYVNLGRCFEF